MIIFEQFQELIMSVFLLGFFLVDLAVPDSYDILGSLLNLNKMKSCHLYILFRHFLMNKPFPCCFIFNVKVPCF